MNVIFQNIWHPGSLLQRLISLLIIFGRFLSTNRSCKCCSIWVFYLSVSIHIPYFIKGLVSRTLILAPITFSSLAKVWLNSLWQQFRSFVLSSLTNFVNIRLIFISAWSNLWPNILVFHIVLYFTATLMCWSSCFRWSKVKNHRNIFFLLISKLLPKLSLNIRWQFWNFTCISGAKSPFNW